MGRIPDGILGGLIGKVGPVTGYYRNGENIIRSASRRKDNIKTAKRAAQQQKIKVCNDFTKAFSGTGFFNKTFPAYGSRGSGYNRATSALMNLAITGTYPANNISYPQVLISKGPLPASEDATVAMNAEGNLLFTWTNNTGRGTAKANDKVVLVAYFPELNQVVFSIGDTTRADELALLQTNQLHSYTAETWIGFLSHDEKDAANSGYAGRVKL